MADSAENRLPLLVQDLRHIQSASHVLAECLSRFSEEPAQDGARQMERLYGVAYLMDLLAGSVEEVRAALNKEIFPH